MKKSKFSESQIIKSVKENEQDLDVDDICSDLEIHKATFDNWHKKTLRKGSQLA